MSEVEMLEVLTPESPHWNEFADGLCRVVVRPDGRYVCDGDGTGERNPKLVHRYAKQVMARMGNVDVEGSIAYFRKHGGHCDCEILFNVDPD